MEKNKWSISFYNLENFFNPENSKDLNFTDEGKQRWTKSKSMKKVEQIAFFVNDVLQTKTKQIVFCFAEIASSKLLEAIANHALIEHLEWNFHFIESKDQRGLGFGLLYSKTIEVTGIECNYVDFKEAYFSRPLCSFKIENCATIVHLNHWPSRRLGNDVTTKRRMKTVQKLLENLDKRTQESPDYAQLIVGDFNMNPDDILFLNLEKLGYCNVSKTLFNYKQGTLRYNRKWCLFDQFLLSFHFFESESKWAFTQTEIGNYPYLSNVKKEPNRTYLRQKYLGGISDHFPIFLEFNLQE